MLYHAFKVKSDLLIRIVNKETTKFDKKDNVVALYNNDNLIGYNILDYNDLDLKDGLQESNDALTKSINSLLVKHNFELLETDTNDYFVVGKIIECEKHPKSNKLSLCKVDINTEVLDIVCGGVNAKKDLKVVVAKVGAVLKSGLWIQPGLVMNETSNGMLCSARELGLEQTYPGILELDDTYNVGSRFEF